MSKIKPYYTFTDEYSGKVKQYTEYIKDLYAKQREIENTIDRKEEERNKELDSIYNRYYEVFDDISLHLQDNWNFKLSKSEMNNLYTSFDLSYWKPKGVVFELVLQENYSDEDSLVNNIEDFKIDMQKFTDMFNGAFPDMELYYMADQFGNTKSLEYALKSITKNALNNSKYTLYIFAKFKEPRISDSEKMNENYLSELGELENYEDETRIKRHTELWSKSLNELDIALTPFQDEYGKENIDIEDKYKKNFHIRLKGGKRVDINCRTHIMHISIDKNKIDMDVFMDCLDEFLLNLRDTELFTGCCVWYSFGISNRAYTKEDLAEEAKTIKPYNKLGININIGWL